MVLKGRLGLETARVPHADRHGCLWLQRGALYVEGGTLRFNTTGGGDLDAGDYAIPFQTISNLLLGPGSTVSHDSLRLLARHGTGLVVTGEDGVRCYASMPFGADDSALARKQVAAWADEHGARIAIARRMYAWRLGELLPSTDLTVLRGIEGARVKTLYRTLAQQHDIQWAGRRYDRDDPEAADLVNQALNHATSALKSAAMIAVAATATIPQLGFIHEDSSASFCLDIADLFREQVALPAAFRAVKLKERQPGDVLERIARRQAGKALREHKVIPAMIDRIKQLFSEPPAHTGAGETRTE
ncbi:MAG: subtype I-E CRISPR-associated endonuclease Cas1 [Deltaproteobacteria bacterium RBG_16_71_12]|nr:MAG: subtype I-E CRISPR-associated endonuclease Cas1 [Deltaproteobacteria bacterium RBG_16_71_12]